jgi:putative transcriptional regulator
MVRNNCMITNNLKDIRRDYGVTQQELAEGVGTTRQTIHSIESGKSLPQLELALKMAYYFDVNLEELFFLDVKGTMEESVEPFSIFGKS